MKTVYISEPIHADALEYLSQHAKIVHRYCDAPAEEISAVLLRAETISRRTMESLPNLEVIGRHGVGMDNVDLAAAKERHIPVVYTPYANSNAVAELALTLTLCLMNRVYENHDRLKQGKKCSGALLSARNCAVGIVGMGRIGSIIARLFQDAFFSDVSCYDPFVTETACAVHRVKKVETVEELVQTSDVVTICVPLTPQTRNLFDARLLSMFRPSGILINTSRGGIVDESALYAALVQGKLFGAGFDAMQGEPIGPQHPLLGLEQFICLPHVGANTQEAMRAMAMTVAEDIVAVLEGRKPRYPLPKQLYP